jgi:hypothetical protein
VVKAGLVFCVVCGGGGCEGETAGNGRLGGVGDGRVSSKTGGRQAAVSASGSPAVEAICSFVLACDRSTCSKCF